MAVSPGKIGLLSTILQAILLAAVSGGMTGCSRNLPPEEYGVILNKVPQLPEAKKPFEMPELGPPLTEDQKRDLERMDH